MTSRRRVQSPKTWGGARGKRVSRSTQITSATGKPETSPDLWIHWVSTYFVDPENWIGQMYDTQFFGTWKASSYYGNAEVDELLRKARSTAVQAERDKLYQEATTCRATSSALSAAAATCAGCRCRSE